MGLEVMAMDNGADKEFGCDALCYAALARFRDFRHDGDFLVDGGINKSVNASSTTEFPMHFAFSLVNQHHLAGRKTLTESVLCMQGLHFFA